jgi:transposase
MISVGIDVAKGKSTVCILKPYGEIISKPFDIAHVEKDLSALATMLLRFDDEVKVVMEATGIYHLPVLTYLQDKGIFVAVINPYLMKVYRSEDLRRAKTDKIDSRIIANYGIEHWFTMEAFQTSADYMENSNYSGNSIDTI